MHAMFRQAVRTFTIAALLAGSAFAADVKQLPGDITLEQAQKVVEAAKAKAKQQGTLMNIAVVDAGGMRGVLLLLPAISMSAYGLVAAGAGLTVILWAKSAENAVDYSVMNTGNALLWLPTTREERYAAKQAVDTFFVRCGDLLAAGLVFAGTEWARVGLASFGLANVVVVLVWVLVTWAVLRRHAAQLAAHL